MADQAIVEAVFTGQPRQIIDDRGTWTSSIYRERVEKPVAISLNGLDGDKVAQPYHGGPGAAICVIRENRTGFYLRVLEPGVVQAGDAWLLQQRLNETGSIPAINRCMYLDFDPTFANLMLRMSGLEEWWKEQARQKLENYSEHWTSAMKDG